MNEPAPATQETPPAPPPDAPPSSPVPPRGRRRNLGTHLFLLSCMATVTVFIAWMTVGELDVVSLAMGEVVPAGQVKSIQHLEGGIVRNILVKEGDRVTEGQALIELEPTRSGADLDELKVRMHALAVNIARLDAEAVGAGDLVVPENLRRRDPELARQAVTLFRTRLARVDNQITSKRQEIIQREHEIKEVKVRLNNSAHELKLVKEQLKISNKLIRLDLTNRMRHLELLKEEAQLKGQIEEDNASLPRARAALNAARAQLAAVVNGFREEAGRDLSDARRTLKELHQRLKKLEDSLKRTVLRAPVGGTIKTLYVVTRGGVIQAGKTVLDIVPGDDRLMVEARLATHDVGYVRIGQEARVQLASAEAVRYGFLDGKVVHVSPDTIITREGPPYYKVRIEPAREFFERGGLRYALSPGMQVQTSIQTGTRTVMEYLLDPYIGQMGLALQER